MTNILELLRKSYCYNQLLNYNHQHTIIYLLQTNIPTTLYNKTNISIKP